MIKQTLGAMNIHGLDPALQMPILEKIISDIPGCLDQPTPSHFQSILLGRLSDYMNVADIYSQDRKRQNASALKFAADARSQIEASSNPLHTSALLAVEGNMIDQLFLGGYDMETALKSIVHHTFSVDHFDIFNQDLKSAQTIAYIADNAGEIVFDRLFIEQCQKWRAASDLPLLKFIAVVKSGPVLNDATLEDARNVQLDAVSEVLQSGTNFLGLPLERVSPQVRELLDAADIIIAKGQANFETLEQEKAYSDKIFFLLKTKCLHISAYFNVPEGSAVFFHPTRG